MRTVWILVGVLLALGVSVARSQEALETEEGPEKKNAVAIFVGALTNLEVEASGPAIGGDYARELNRRLSFLVSAEWARASERESAFGVGVEVKPVDKLELTFAPGAIIERLEEGEELERSETRVIRKALFVFRSGIGYELELSGTALFPSLYVDLVKVDAGVEVHLVYGLRIELPF